MSARIKISQAGLSAGVAGKARTDGLATGALVTLEDVSGAGLSTFHLLWVPVEDTAAEASLAVTGDPDIWTFSPMAAAYGSYLVELRVSGVPVERRVFGIRTPANHLLIPALNERASRHGALDNDGADQIELSDNNASDFPLSVLNSFRYAGWWRSLYELYRVVEFGIGSIADHALALVKLVTVPAKSVLANATNATGDVTALAGSAAFQYLRVNSANNALEWATLSGHASTSLVYDGATNTFQQAAVTGAITQAQNSNTTAFAAAAAKSVLVNATNGSAVPAFLAGTGAFQYLRVNSANNALEWAVSGCLATKATLVTITNATTPNLLTPAGFSVPAGTLVAGSKFRYIGFFSFTRGATATALNILCSASIGANSVTATIATATTASFSGFGWFFADLTVLTTGAGGTGMLTVRALHDCLTGNAVGIASAENQAIAIDTTVANTVQGNVSMSAAVAATTLAVTSGDIARTFN